jgi:TPR repeat protein
VVILLSVLGACATARNRELTNRADSGDVTAQHWFCYGHSYGEEGLPKDYNRAHYWCKKAAENGSSSSQTLFAELYFFGYGVSQNYEVALVWYRKAADQRHSHAQYMIGAMYLEGLGVLKDPYMAKHWLIEAALQGHEGARGLLKQLK